MKKLTKAEMLETVKKFCGASSIAYMNLNMYANVDYAQFKILYENIMERELNCIKIDIAEKEEQLEQLRAKEKELEKLLK